MAKNYNYFFGQKVQFLSNFDIFGGSCTDPLLPMRAKFGGLEQTQGLHLPAKFHLNVFRKPQNRPLSKLNTGRFALRAMLPVINACEGVSPQYLKHIVVVTEVQKAR